GDHEVSVCRNDSARGDERAVLYRPQSVHGRLREYLILSGIPQHLERQIERHEKWNGRYIRICQKWIVEVHLKEGGVDIPALGEGFPEHGSKDTSTDEHDHELQEYR